MTKTAEGWIASRAKSAKTEAMQANAEAQKAMIDKVDGKAYDDLKESLQPLEGRRLP
jgi:hypothetical protein